MSWDKIDGNTAALNRHMQTLDAEDIFAQQVYARQCEYMKDDDYRIDAICKLTAGDYEIEPLINDLLKGTAEQKHAAHIRIESLMEDALEDVAERDQRAENEQEPDYE